MRIDRLLWFLRLARSRTAAQALVGEGHVRLNARRVERLAQAVAPGDVLTLPLAQGVRVIAIETLPTRRGPPAEARAHYRALDEGGGDPIAASHRDAAASGAACSTDAAKGNLPP